MPLPGTTRVAVAVFVLSTVLVAVTVIVCGSSFVLGAVYKPVELIVPPPDTDQVTELLIYQPTAPSCAVVPPVTVSG